MTTLLLVRHGDTDAIGKVLAGWQPGWTLNTTGKARVSRLAEQMTALPLAAVYSSPVERALETANLLAGPHNQQPLVRDGLGEVRFGSWEGQTFDSLQQDPQWDAYNRLRSGVTPPGGESMQDVQTRMVRETDAIRRHHPDATVAVVSHGDPIRVLCAYHLGTPLDLMHRFEISLASVSALRFHDEPGAPPQLLFINFTGDIVL